jgi:hypothetical protein
MNSKRLFGKAWRTTALATLVAALAAGSAMAFSPMPTGSTVPRWQKGSFPLSYELRGNIDGERAALIKASLEHWTKMTKVDFKASLVEEGSGRGTVIPVFESQRLPAGVAAVTGFNMSGNGYYQVAQIAVNTAQQMSPLAYEIAVTHEMGHSFGLNHSDRIGAIMNSFLEQRALGTRPHYDDWAGTTYLYGLPEVAQKTGCIAGEIRVQGEPIDNADVIVRLASNGALAGVVRTGIVQKGFTAATGQSRAVGRYTLNGLPPGEYVLLTINSRLNAQGRLSMNSPNADAIVSRTYFGGSQYWQQGKRIQVVAGKTTPGINIDAHGQLLQ